MEHERRKHEAEIERTCEQERANHQKELAFLTAERKIAIANAKLKAIEQAIEEEDIGDKIEIAGIPNAKSEKKEQSHGLTPRHRKPASREPN